MILTLLQVKDFNDVLQKEVDQNLNRLYDGVFHKVRHSSKFPLRPDVSTSSWRFLTLTFPQETSQASSDQHHELLEHSDFIFYNVTDGLKAMDTIRFQIRDPKTPVMIKNIPKKWVVQFTIGGYLVQKSPKSEWCNLQSVNI